MTYRAFAIALGGFLEISATVLPVLKPICTSLQEGLDHPARSLTGGYLIKSALNLHKTRESWGTNGHRLGIVCYIEGAYRGSYR